MNSKEATNDGHSAIVMATNPEKTCATVVPPPIAVAGLKNDVHNITSSQSSNQTPVPKLSMSESAINFLVKNQNGQMVLQPAVKTPTGNGASPVVTSTKNTLGPLGSFAKGQIIVRKSGSMATPSPAQLGEIVERMGIKRPLPGGSSGIVTKVIITKNPVSGQPQAQPARPPTQTINLGSSAISNQLGATTTLLQQQSGGAAPETKTVTLSSLGATSSISSLTPTLASSLSSSPGKTVIATLPNSGVAKLNVPFQKIPLSPAKTPTKITMIPVSKSPITERFLATGQARPVSNANITVLSKALSSLSQTGNIKPGSPSKVIIKQGPAPSGSGSSVTLKPGSLPVLAPNTAQVSRGMSPQVIQGLRQPQVAINVRPAMSQAAKLGTLQQIQVPGSKFNYVRLVSLPGGQQASVTVPKPLTAGVSQSHVNRNPIPITMSASSSQSNQVKITLPVQQNTLLAPKPLTVPVNLNSQSNNTHRIILPATSSTGSAQQGTSLISTPSTLSTSNLPAIQPAISPVAAANVGQLPPGTAILSAGGNNLQGFSSIALVPASYVTQLQQMNKPENTQAPMTASIDPALPPRHSSYVPIASIDPAITQYTLSRNAPPQNGPTLEATGARPRKPCNCTKSQCLKLYCDCFANGEFCQNCNCTNCANNLEHEEERSKAIKSCLDRNPQAFHPKIGKSKDIEGNRRHTKGCNCKRSGCLKNYCECYEAKIMCSEYCKCVGCKNFEESPERKTLMHLADAAEVRVQQQTAAKTKLSSQISSLPVRPPVATATGERLPFALITADVAEATSACLLAQAEEAERMKMPPVVQERMIIEEFGRCLMQIIESANRTKANSVV